MRNCRLQTIPSRLTFIRSRNQCILAIAIQMNYSSSPLDSSTNSGSSRWLKVLGLRFLEGEYLGKDVTFEEGEGATETAGPDGIASNSCPDGVG